jgi:hypothetical protein
VAERSTKLSVVGPSQQMRRERGLTYFRGSAGDYVSGRFSGVASLLGSCFVMIDMKALPPLFSKLRFMRRNHGHTPTDARAMEDRPAEL